jgi:hypothetical protein
LRLPVPEHGKDPFARVFLVETLVTPDVMTQAPPPTVPAREATERVVCGMRLIPTDPTLDRGMVHRPERPGAEPAARRIHPTACVDSRVK